MGQVVGRITGFQMGFRDGERVIEYIDQDGNVLTWLEEDEGRKRFDEDGRINVTSINGVPVHDFNPPTVAEQPGKEWSQMIKQDSTRIRRFTAYRRNISERDSHNDLQKNADDLPQFEGVVFTDGTVALRWLTAVRATSVWASLKDALAIHGHPEYGTEIVWHDDPAAPIEWLDQVDRALAASLMTK